MRQRPRRFVRTRVATRPARSKRRVRKIVLCQKPRRLRCWIARRTSPPLAFRTRPVAVKLPMMRRVDRARDARTELTETVVVVGCFTSGAGADGPVGGLPDPDGTSPDDP